MQSKSVFFFFKLLVTLPNYTEAGKRVNATVSRLRLKKQDHLSSTDDLTVHFGQCISTKDDPFVQNTALLLVRWQTLHVYARIIRYAIEFSTVVRYKGLRKLQRATQFFQEAQVTYAYLLDRAGCRQSD